MRFMGPEAFKRERQVISDRHNAEQASIAKRFDLVKAVLSNDTSTLAKSVGPELTLAKSDAHRLVGKVAAIFEQSYADHGIAVPEAARAGFGALAKTFAMVEEAAAEAQSNLRWLQDMNELLDIRKRSARFYQTPRPATNTTKADVIDISQRRH